MMQFHGLCIEIQCSKHKQQKFHFQMYSYLNRMYLCFQIVNQSNLFHILQMSSLKLFAIFSVSLAIAVQNQNCQGAPKISEYLGRGYDIYLGNPLMGEVDLGFKYEVIDLAYNGKRTEDNKFLIPDKISARKISSCSFKSDASEFRGTQSYQDQLKAMVSVGGGFEASGFALAFTSSVGFRRMQQKVDKQETIVYQATSQCLVYKLALDNYVNYAYSTNFVQAIDLAVMDNDWETFFNQYGTHYVTQVSFGGRAVLEADYSKNTVMDLKQSGIDVNASIKASFSGFFGQVGTANSVSQSQRKQVENVRQKFSNYTLGGAPKGSIGQWQTVVSENPMPVRYSLALLSDLFSKIPGKQNDWVVKAKQFYSLALKGYCTKIGCKNPSPQKSLPRKVYSTQVSTSQTYGGNGGNFFYYIKREPNWHVVTVRVRSGKQIDAIQLFLANTQTGARDLSPQYGGTGGDQKYFNVIEGDYISQIKVRSGTRLDNIRFYTAKGRTNNEQFGRDGGTNSMIYSPGPEFRMVGIYGKCAQRIDQIGIIWLRTIKTYVHHNKKGLTHLKND